MTAVLGRLGPLAAVRRLRYGWQRVSPFLGASRTKLVVLSAVSIGAGFAEAALLGLIAAIATALSGGDSRVVADLGPVSLDSSLSVLFLVGFGLAGIRLIFQVAAAYLPSEMSATATVKLRTRLFDAFSGTAWSVQAAERDGHFQSLLGGHVNQTSNAIVALGQSMTAGFMFCTLLATALALSPVTALMLVVLSGTLFLAMRPLSRRTQYWSQQLSDEKMEFSKGKQEIVRLAEETQVFGASAAYRRTFHDLIAQVRVPVIRTRFLSRLVPVLFQSFALVVVLLALVVVAQLDVDQLASLGAVVLILIRSLNYGQQMQTAITKMYELTPFMDRLRDGIDHYNATPRQDGDQPMPEMRTIGMSDAHFSYVPGEVVLDGFEFEVRAGEAVGVVGPSGAGKSTLVQMLLRLREPDTGMLHVNGVDARRIRRADWQRHVAYVPQSPQLIWGTVRDNIRYYRSGVDDADVERAARLAHIHEDIVTWPEGYDTVIGERASAVSGGQRQRLCLARSLAGRPSVLILDEPTSALDVRSEMMIQDSLVSLKGEMTLFMVAHRLSTLSVCDRVMVIVDGRLQAIDTPDRLFTSNQFYREAIEITREQTSV